jgi:hypothetical protein
MKKLIVIILIILGVSYSDELVNVFSPTKANVLESHQEPPGAVTQWLIDHTPKK